MANNAYSAQHAEVVIEGIYDGSIKKNDNSIKGLVIGKKFTIISHLRGENDIEIKDIKKLHYTQRTKVWLLSSKKINKMLNDMFEEKKAENTKFSILGNYSPFSGGRHNCITWALYHLRRIGVDLEPPYGFFGTHTKSYTKEPNYYLKNPEYPKI